jgi:ATP-dependent exoDNAse (exonuclease V) alpha subunit
MEIILSPEQQEVIRLVKNGENVLVTGSAGTGKSTLLRALSQELKYLPITGSTGVSAVNVQGLTIHSWAGIGFGEQPVDKILDELRPICKKRIQKAKRLAIDEISMIHGDVLDLLNELFQKVRKNPAPFGGIQMIFFGDFLQLPPVTKEDMPQKFAFQADSWKKGAVKTCLLTEVFRQEDAMFSRVLNDVRIGNITAEVRAVLDARINQDSSKNRVEPIIIHTHNGTVDNENRKKLDQIKEQHREWRSRDQGQMGPLNTLQRNCLAPEVLVLKKGAQVMLLWNIATEEGLANGSLGVITGFCEETGLPIVWFQNGSEDRIERRTWTITHGEEVLASRSQIPLRLAWAITAHKCQGMTLDSVKVSLSKSFSPGQAYVALSRCRTLEGLYIQDIDYNRITAHPDALAFYGIKDPERCRDCNGIHPNFKCPAPVRK